MGNENSGRRIKYDLDYMEIGRLYFDEGLTQAEIAERYSVDRSIISKFIGKYRDHKGSVFMAEVMKDKGPAGATHHIGAVHYKVGHRGLVYRWDGIEWVRNSMTWNDMIRTAVKL